MRKLSDQNKIDIVNQYNSGKSMTELSDKYKCSVSNISNLLRRRNIKIRSMSKSRRKYKVDETFFDKIDSHEKAQILGFLYADGCNDDKNIISVGIVSKDVDYLKTILNTLKSTHPIKYTKNKKYVMFSIRNKELSNKLKLLGCIPRKSLVLKFPLFLDKKYHNSFIRGYFEGDGSVFITKDNQAGFSICGTKDMCENISKIIENEVGISISVKTNKSIYCISIRGRNGIEKVMDWLYSNSTKLLMKRKHDIYLKIKREVHHKSSKYKCVCFEKETKKWRSYINTDKKMIKIGRFNSELDAVKSFNQKCIELNLPKKTIKL